MQTEKQEPRWKKTLGHNIDWTQLARAERWYGWQIELLLFDQDHYLSKTDVTINENGDERVNARGVGPNQKRRMWDYGQLPRHTTAEQPESFFTRLKEKSYESYYVSFASKLNIERQNLLKLLNASNLRVRNALMHTANHIDGSIDKINFLKWFKKCGYPVRPELEEIFAGDDHSKAEPWVRQLRKDFFYYVQTDGKSPINKPKSLSAEFLRRTHMFPNIYGTQDPTNKDKIIKEGIQEALLKEKRHERKLNEPFTDGTIFSMTPEGKLPPMDDYEAELINEQKKLLELSEKGFKEYWEFRVKNGLCWDEIKDEEGNITQPFYDDGNTPRKTWEQISQGISPNAVLRERHPTFDYDNKLNDTYKELRRISDLFEGSLEKAVTIDKKLGARRSKRRAQPIIKKVKAKIAHTQESKHVKAPKYLFKCTGDQFQIKFGDNTESFTRDTTDGLLYIQYLLNVSQCDNENIKNAIEQTGIKSLDLFYKIKPPSATSSDSGYHGQFDERDLLLSDDGEVTTGYQTSDEMQNDLKVKASKFWEDKYDPALGITGDEGIQIFCNQSHRKQYELIEKKIQGNKNRSSDTSEQFDYDKINELLEEFLSEYYINNHGKITGNHPKVTSAIGHMKIASQTIQKAIWTAIKNIETPSKGNSVAFSKKLASHLRKHIKTGKLIKVINDNTPWKLS